MNPGGTEVAGDGTDNDCDPATVVASDLYEAFSSTANPNGQWSLGYAYDATGASVTLFDTCAEHDASLDFWYAAGVEGVRVYRNHTASDWAYSTARFDAMALTLHPGAAGEYAVVRWTAPVPTECAVDVVFSANGNTSSTVALVAGGTAVTDSTIDGLDDTYPVAVTVELAAGENVDFVVGYNGSYYFDSTGLVGTLACLGGPWVPG